MITFLCRVALYFLRYLIPQKLVLVDNVVEKMTGNPAFTTPNPPLADVTTARTNLSDAHMAVVAAEDTLTLLRMQEQEMNRALDALLTQLANYCQTQAAGDVAVLESSGFPLLKQRTPVGPLPAPINLRSVAGEMPGSSDLFWKSIYGTKSYVAQCALSPSGPWTTFYTGSKARCTGTGLTSGTLYYFRVAAIGAAGQGPWSDISEKRAP